MTLQRRNCSAQSRDEGPYSRACLETLWKPNGSLTCLHTSPFSLASENTSRHPHDSGGFVPTRSVTRISHLAMYLYLRLRRQQGLTSLFGLAHQLCAELDAGRQMRQMLDLGDHFGDHDIHLMRWWQQC